MFYQRTKFRTLMVAFAVHQREFRGRI